MTAMTVQPEETRAASAPYALSIESAGLFTLLIGAWAGIVPYVAPTFSYSADGAAAWTWNLPHTLLFLVPGGVAFLAGLLIVVEGWSSNPSRRALLGLAGFFAALSGAWLVVGPFAWPVLEGHAFFIVSSTSTKQLATWVMYSLGTGGLLLALGAFVLGRPRSSVPAVVGAPLAREASVEREPVVTDQPATVMADEAATP